MRAARLQSDKTVSELNKTVRKQTEGQSTTTSQEKGISMFGKDVEKKANRGTVMCFLVAVYTVTSIVFLLQVNQYTQDIYDFPYLVSSQARIMKSRLYDFRSLTPVLFSSKDLNSAQLENALKTQESLQHQSIVIIEDRYRGKPEELQELKDALAEIGQKKRELVDRTRGEPTVENVITLYNQIVEPAFIHFDDILDRIATNADQRGSDIKEKSDRNIYGFVICTILMGILLLWFIYTGSRDLNRAYLKGLKRDKLLKLLYANVDDVFIIFNEKKEPEYVSDNSLRILGFDADSIESKKEELLNRFYKKDKSGYEASSLTEISPATSQEISN